MTATDRPVDLAGVAEMLGKSLGWTQRHIRRLRDEHGFPRPLPLLRRYDPEAIRTWQRKQGGATPAEEDWAALLDARAARLSAGKGACR